MAYRGTGQDSAGQGRAGWAGLGCAGPGRAGPGMNMGMGTAWEGQGTEELTWAGQANLGFPRRASKTRSTQGMAIQANVACDEGQGKDPDRDRQSHTKIRIGPDQVRLHHIKDRSISAGRRQR